MSKSASSSAEEPDINYAYFDHEITAVNSARNILDGFGEIIETEDIVTTEMTAFWLREGKDYLRDILLKHYLIKLDRYFQDETFNKVLKIVFPYRLEKAWHWNAAELVFTKSEDGNWSVCGSKYDPYGFKSKLEDDFFTATKEKFQKLFGQEIEETDAPDLTFEAGQFGGIGCGVYAAFILHKLKTNNYDKAEDLERIWDGLKPTEKEQREEDLRLVTTHCSDLLDKFGKINQAGFVSHQLYLPKPTEADSHLEITIKSRPLLDAISAIFNALDLETLNNLLYGKFDTVLENAFNLYDLNKGSKETEELACIFQKIATYISLALEYKEEIDSFNYEFGIITEKILQAKSMKPSNARKNPKLTEKFRHISQNLKAYRKDLDALLKEYNIDDTGMHGENIMHWAIYYKNISLVNALITKNKRLARICDSDKKRTPICWAAERLKQFRSFKTQEITKNLLSIILELLKYSDEEVINSRDLEKKNFLDYFKEFCDEIKKSGISTYSLQIRDINKSVKEKRLPAENPLLTFPDMIVDWRSSLDIELELGNGEKLTLDGDVAHRELRYVESTFRSQLRSGKLEKSESHLAKKEDGSASKAVKGFEAILLNSNTTRKIDKQAISSARRKAIEIAKEDEELRRSMILSLQKEVEEESLAKKFEEACSVSKDAIDRFRNSLSPEKQKVFLQIGSESSKEVELGKHKKDIEDALKHLEKDPKKKDDTELKTANFVPARLTFVVNIAGKNRIIEIPVVFDNNTNIYSVYDLWNSHYTTASNRNSLSEDFLKLRAKTLDFKGDIDIRYKHSEQALIDLLDQPQFAQKTVKKIIFAITNNRNLAKLITTADAAHNRSMLKLLETNEAIRDHYKITLEDIEKVKSLKIEYAILDIHSYRYICRDCSVSLHNWSNPEISKYSFINNLENCLQSLIGNTEKRTRVSSTIKTVVRASTDVEFKQPRKTAAEHSSSKFYVEKDKPLIMRVLSRDSRDDELIDPKTSPGRRITKYSIATSGGKSENKQEYQLAYNKASLDEVNHAVKLIQGAWRSKSGASSK
jgi:hypothetical protein